MANFIRSYGETAIEPRFLLWFLAYVLFFGVCIRGCVYEVPPKSGQGSQGLPAR